ncbi:MAG: bifunctional 4-hydroxy-2-oxoglutarate aldolase/2-dehydro-3-deoxy-phosphogluconate aldolase [Bacteroidales bacterium]|nr:bifunctional 4-hydroxy-2-oxoglutarate aldolase/2-dehydro-3-deoxy-phosphogluconate aldolase [Bacteroidales bacterium]MDT8430487.1 bifunctional 4-hydroxy-2-oxoglutarate aldolase/2-dehydro-3-deoxy-phosphogluconate aldolase [Bacteroidales bacterium]
MKRTRLDTAILMRETGVVPLYYNPDTETCKQVIRACYNGGLKIFEFTNRGDFAHEVFGALVKWAEKELPDLVLGVGSVVDAATSALYIQQGASFIVSPLLNKEMARVCNRRKVLWMPGCATVSEISKAEELGAEVVKVYPASMLGGPAYIKAIKGPCPWSQLMPSGGVSPTLENLKSWFDAGAFCVGMGSKLITSDIIRENKYDLLQDKAAEIVQMVEKIRG